MSTVGGWPLRWDELQDLRKAKLGLDVGLTAAQIAGAPSAVGVTSVDVVVYDVADPTLRYCKAPQSDTFQTLAGAAGGTVDSVARTAAQAAVDAAASKVTAQQAAAAAPVQRVAGKSGDITLAVADLTDFYSKVLLDVAQQNAAKVIIGSGSYTAAATGNIATDTANLRAAMVSSADVVQVGEGNYVLDSVITAGLAGRRITGIPGKTRWTMAGGTNHDFALSSPNGATNTVIENIIFDGNVSNRQLGTALNQRVCGLLQADQSGSNASFDFILRNSRLINGGSHAVRLWPGSARPKFLFSQFVGWNDVILEPNPWTDGMMIGCEFLDYAKAAYYASATGPVGLFYAGSDRWIIGLNRLAPSVGTGPREFALEFGNGGYGIGCEGMLIVVNAFDAGNANANGNNTGTGISGLLNRSIVSVNTLTNGAGATIDCGIEIIGAGNLLQGNVLDGGGIFISGGAFNKVTHNTIRTARTVAPSPLRPSTAIRTFDGLTDSQITDNLISFAAPNFTGGYGFQHDSGVFSRNVVADNLISCGGGPYAGNVGGISVENGSGTDNTIKSNDVFGCAGNSGIRVSANFTNTTTKLNDVLGGGDNPIVVAGASNLARTYLNQTPLGLGAARATQTYFAPAVGDTVTPDANVGGQVFIDMPAGTINIAAPSGGTAGDRITILIHQDGVGGRVPAYSGLYKKAADGAGTSGARGIGQYEFDGTFWHQLGGAVVYR